MGIVSVYNKSNPLEEVIVGSALGARIPSRDRSLHAIEYRGTAWDAIPSGPFPPDIIAETQEALDELAEILTGRGVTVHRPELTDTSGIVSTPTGLPPASTTTVRETFSSQSATRSSRPPCRYAHARGVFGV